MKLSELARLLLSPIFPSLWFSDVQTTWNVEHQASTVAFPAVALDITHIYDNIAVGPNANFDPNYGHSWVPEFLPTSSIILNGIEFRLPDSWNGEPDNVVSNGQLIVVPDVVGYAREMQILYAGDWIDGESGAKFTFTFEDGSQQVVEASIHNWWNLHWINSGAAIKTPYHLTPGGGVDYNVTQMYTWSTSVNSASPLKNITLPPLDGNRLHIFAITLVPSVTSAPTEAPVFAIRSTKLTTKYRIINGQRALAAEVVIANVVPSLVAPNPNFWVNEDFLVAYTSPLLKTVQYGEFERLMPGDQLIVRAWVVPRDPSSVEFSHWRRAFASMGGTLEIRNSRGTIVLQEDVVPDGDNIDVLERDIPEWFENAKFGIFMHWGVFSVPGWAPPGVYAEWYWWHQHNPPDSSNSFWTHHLETYGADFVYDDFIPQLGGKFNASAIVGLVADSGAKYFVPTTMHHDGFAIFDTGNATHRSSKYLGPQRDFLGELFDAAKAEHPDLVRGTYFSMPEWFDPDVGAGGYGFGTWPGQLALNAYDLSKTEPYTGRLPIDDFLRDEQLVKMKILAEQYETQIIWCDIGGPNLTRTFVEEWLPFADERNLQIVMNNRCGALPQFDTPEYATFASIQTQKWESSESVDPASYGYNSQTKPEDYRSPAYLITSLVDIVSKGGNYLLNIGPDGDGVVIQPIVDRLLAVGAWLKHSGECIYGTDFFFPGAQYGSLRFTRTRSTFCIIALERPTDESVVIDTPIPLLVNDTISLLGAGPDGANLTWADHDGTITIKAPNAILDKVENAWAFRVLYQTR